MMTIDQKKEINDILKGRNLPLDLKVEILDHMVEQVEDKIQFERKDFSTTIEEIRISWKSDLRLTKRFWWKESRTQIHRDTIKRADIAILKTSTKYFSAFLAISILFIISNKSAAAIFIFSFYTGLVAIFTVLVLFDLKIIRSLSKNSGKRVSYLQKKSGNIIISSVLIIALILVNFSERFDKYYSSLNTVMAGQHISMAALGPIIIFNIYAFLWIYSFLYYIKYKKSLKNLEQKINFKL